MMIEGVDGADDERLDNPTASYSWTMRDDGDNDGRVVVIVVVVVDGGGGGFVLTVEAPALAADDGGSLPAATSGTEAGMTATAVDDIGWKYGCWRTASARWIRCDGSYSSIFSMRSNSCR